MIRILLAAVNAALAPISIPAEVLANVPRFAVVAFIKPDTGVPPAPAVPPKVLSKVIEPFRLITPLTAIPPPEEIAFRLTLDPTPVELSVIAIKVIACLDPLVLFRVRVGVKPAVATLKVKAVVWVIVPDAMIVTLVPALIAV